MRLFVAVCAGLALGGIGAFAALSASAGGKASPSISFVAPSPDEGATVNGDSVTFKFTYTKKPKQTRSLVCSLSGPTSSEAACDTPTASQANRSQSSKSYSGLPNGSYTFTVSLLVNGGTATATRHFDIFFLQSTPTPTPETTPTPSP
jgi:hypothetical protein